MDLQKQFYQWQHLVFYNSIFVFGCSTQNIVGTHGKGDLIVLHVH